MRPKSMRKTRRNSRHRSYSVKRLYEYLAQISLKYKIDSDTFFQCLIDAWRTGKSKCKQLVIECRKKNEDSAVFLFTSRNQVISQFMVPKNILLGDNPLKEYTEKILAKKSLFFKDKSEKIQIKDLAVRMRKVTVKARVLDISKPRVVVTRFGFQTFVANAVIADETGTIELSLWNKQIDLVSLGDVIMVENGHVASFRGKRQLRLGRGGRISVVKDKAFKSIQNPKKI